MFSATDLYAQINGTACSDSSYRIRYTSLLPSLNIVNFKNDDKNGFLFSGGIINPQSPTQVEDMVLGKMNSEGKLLWARNANRIPFNEDCIIYDCVANANSIYWAGSLNYKPFIIKTDTSGNLISSFYYTINYGLGAPPISIRKIKYFNDNEIYLFAGASESGSFSPYNLIIKLRSDGTVIWSKAFKTGNGFGSNTGWCFDLVKQGNELVVFGNFETFSTPIQTYIRGVVKMKLNESDGQLLQTASYTIPALNQPVNTTTNPNFKIVSVHKGTSLILIANDLPLFPSGSFTNKVIKLDLDSSLNLSKITQVAPFTIDGANTITDVDVNYNNQTCITINNGVNYYHTLLNEHDSLVKTLKIKTSVRSLPIDYTLHRLVYEINGSITHLMRYDIAAENKYELFKLKSGWKSSTEYCMGKDTSFVTVNEISYSPYNFSWDEVADNIVQMQALNISINNLSLSDEVVCKEYSLCDTIKIKGNTKHCLTNPAARFTLYKNPQCLRKIIWTVDTTSIKITSQPNDTIIDVEFLHAFHGYIRAAFEGCTLKDSFYIDVNEPKRSIYLGKDTMYCPGKTITLNAGAGFKTYLWQDNSNDSTFIARKPGTYFLTAMDSCDNIFKDTIVVKPMDITFDLLYLNPVCLYDTATITLYPELKNYLWSPSNEGIQENGVLKLFPSSTIVFNISAERFTGCSLSDTLFIKVNVCPSYLYIPNAFTPNNDSKNDIFKPVVSGRIEQYQFSVYNRYGQQIFNSNIPNQGWDGKIEGRPQDAGVFIWTCSYRFLNKLPVLKKGIVMLVR